MQKTISLFILSIVLLACQSNNKDAKRLLDQGLQQVQNQQAEAAVTTYYQAINELKSSHNDSLLALAHNRLGDVLFKKNINKNARAHFQIAQAHAQSLEDKTLLAFAYRGLGKTYFFRKTDSSFYYFHKAQDLKESISDPEEISSIYNNLANLAYTTKDYRSALKYNTKALQLTNNQDKIDRNFALRGQVYAYISQFDSAFYYIHQASHSQNIRTRASSYIKLTELPPEAGLSDSLKFTYAQKANALVDSIERVDDIIRLVEISNQAEHTEQAKQFNWIVFGFSSLVISILLIIFYKMKHQTITQQENHTLTQKNQTNIQNIQEKLIASIQNFTSTPQYQEMRKVLAQNEAQFSYKELEELQKETLLHFKPYIKLLQPILSLSDKDAYLCCLFALKLSIKECAICRNVSPETIRSQKARIKKRIPQEWLELEIHNILF